MLENYKMNEDGVVFQVHVQPDAVVYDTKYVQERYDTYGEKNLEISALRLGHLVGSIGYIPGSILDVGYGNGAFLKQCKKIIPNCYGSDITGYPLPEGVKFVENWVKQPTHVITFFDVLEHLPDPYILKNVHANYIVISLPWFHNLSDDWFRDWKHRRLNEHLWFFNPASMTRFATSIDCEVIDITNIEDVVRSSGNHLENIMTVVLRKR
jgi:hypothetical protein